MIVYATDEDLAIRAPADFLAICPRDQVLVAGLDGLFLTTDPWTLRSPSVDFAGAGLTPGQIIRLAGSSLFSAQGELYAIVSAGPGGLTLRRKGQCSGVGRPPSFTANVMGIEFEVRTFGPQIDRACSDLNLRFGIDEAIPGRTSCDLRDPES